MELLLSKYTRDFDSSISAISDACKRAQTRMSTRIAAESTEKQDERCAARGANESQEATSARSLPMPGRENLDARKFSSPYSRRFTVTAAHQVSWIDTCRAYGMRVCRRTHG